MASTRNQGANNTRTDVEWYVDRRRTIHTYLRPLSCGNIRVSSFPLVPRSACRRRNSLFEAVHLSSQGHLPDLPSAINQVCTKRQIGYKSLLQTCFGHNTTPKASSVHARQRFERRAEPGAEVASCLDKSQVRLVFATQWQSFISRAAM